MAHSQWAVATPFPNKNIRIKDRFAVKATEEQRIVTKPRCYCCGLDQDKAVQFTLSAPGEGAITYPTICVPCLEVAVEVGAGAA